MINKIILLLLIFNSTILSAQTKTVENEIFKIQLWLNKKSLTKNNGQNESKDSYKNFCDSFNLSLNKLKVQNNLIGLFDQEYVFYRVFESDIVFKEGLSNEDYKLLDIQCYPSNSYILAINQTTGSSFKLKGFETNDFASFLFDLKRNLSNKNFQIRDFLKNFKVEGLDFECLYEGLNINKEVDIVKYPCLIKCSDLLKIKS
jgi:hypothetical protein